MESILISIKKLLGIAEEYTHFDVDILIHINSALMTLCQIGVGPKEGYFINGKEERWIDYIGEDNNLEPVKTYIYLKTRLVFDPPTASVVIDAIQRQITELEWRLNTQVEVQHDYEG